MIKLFFWVIPLLTLCNAMYAQALPKEYLGLHTVYAEAGGVCGLYSINYDRVFYSKRRAFNFALGGGFSYNGGGVNKNDISYFPLCLSLLIHHSPSWSGEIGIDPSLAFEASWSKLSKNAPSSYRIGFRSGGFVPHIGYRYQKEEGGFFAKIYFSLLTSTLGNNLIIYQTGAYANPWDQTVVPWGGIGFGYTFKRKPNYK